MDTFIRMIKHPSLLIALKILLVILGSEAVIMAAFLTLPLALSPLTEALIDTVLLGLIAATVIYFWVLKPLNKAKQQNDLFNTLVNNLDVGVVVTDPNKEDHPIVFVNQAFTRISGYQADEVIGRNPRLMQGDDVDPAALKQTREAIRKQQPVRVLQRNRRKDGTPFWNDLHLNPIFNHHGQVQFWVGLINDVTATKELEKDNRRWASALQQSDEAFCVFDVDGNIEIANEAFCSNVRLSESELIGRSAFPFWDQDSETCLKDSLQQVSSWSGRHQRHRADQSTYDALTSITPIHDEQGEVSFISVHRDISEMVVMEAQLRQSQKMEAVGMLVGGIAHDFNNVLAGMLGNLYLVRKKLKDVPKLQKRIESVEEQGYAAAGMVRQLLSFSRKGMPDVKNLDLAPFTKELVKFASVSVPENIEFICHIENRKIVASCDPVQLQQSLLNLIVNATHAVQAKHDGKGRIELNVNVVQPPENLPYHDLPTSDTVAQEWVCMSIRDNGTGMDQQTRDKMFEPFFTTKASGTGTGLGLAMVLGYIEMLHGSIEVESAPGEGTCLSIYLPLSASEHAHQREELMDLRRGQGELVLIADDDSSVLHALSEILESANYRVLMADDGEHAMQLFSEHADKLDMAILDVVMPKASGIQAARHMRSQRNDFPITMMTGYDRDHEMSLEQDGAYLMLRKPWNITSLNAVLASSLSD